MPTLWISICLFNSLLVDASLNTTSSGQTWETYESSDRMFLNGDITCTKWTCNIICNRSFGCEQLYINASQSNILTITCSESNSCQNISIISDTTISTKINCTSSRSCYNAVFDLGDSSIVDLRCDSYSCSGMKIFADDSDKLTVNCNTAHSCNDIKIYADNTGKLMLHCSTANSCHGMNVFADHAGAVIIYSELDSLQMSTFYLSHTRYVQIKCFGNYACYENDWYLPDYGTNTIINCYGYGCYRFGTIYADTSISSLVLNIKKCSPSSLCIDSLSIGCNFIDKHSSYHGIYYRHPFYANYTTFNGKNCSTNHCGCNDMLLNINNQDDKTNQWHWYTIIILIIGIAIINTVLVGVIYCKRKQSEKGYSQPVDCELEHHDVSTSAPTTEIQQMQPIYNVPDPSAPVIYKEFEEKTRGNEERKCDNNAPVPTLPISTSKKEIQLQPILMDGEQKQEQPRGDDLCVVCLDGIRDHVLIPCGHICICEECKISYNNDNAKCPLCRSKVNQIIKTYH